MPNVRDYMYRERRRKLHTHARETGGVEVTDHQQETMEQAGRASQDEGRTASTEVGGVGEVQKNPSPLKQTIHRMPTKWQRRIRNLIRLVRYWWGEAKLLAYGLWKKRWWREKTAIEIEEEEEQKRRRKLAKTLRREALEYARRASNAYARMRQRYVPPQHQQNMFNKERRVEFDRAIGEPNAIWLRIRTSRLPHGVDILKLVDDEVILTNVSASLRHHVEGMFTVEHGAWLCIVRGQGARGIPERVDYTRLMELMPQSADDLTIPFGETRNSKRIYRSLRPLPHMLVGGSTGNGKTNYLNGLILSLIQQNTPDDIKMVMVDLKGGVEFGQFRGLPHLWKIPDVTDSGIIMRADGVVPLLRALIKEGERRLSVFGRANVTNITDYNRHKRGRKRMRRIIFLIDEWARIAYSEWGNQADQLLSDITATYRAVGFHVVLATQRPTVKVVSGLIKTNFNARLCFAVPSNTASMVVLDNGEASKLPGSTPGRAIFRLGTTQVEVQTPLVESSLVRKIVQQTIESGGEAESNELSMEDIFRYSLAHLNGSLARRPLYEHFQGRITNNALVDWLQSYDEDIVNIDETTYQVVPSNGGSDPRRLEIFPPNPPNV